jgi:hypothetical protein
MASTVFTDNQTVIYAAWLNDVNNVVYNGIFVSPSITATSVICNGTASGAGFTNLINNTFTAPGPIGSVTPNTGQFTTLQATGALSAASASFTAGLPIASGGTGLTTAGTSGFALVSTGTALQYKKLGLGMSGEVWVPYTINVDRSSGTTYTNSNAYPIMVSAHGVTGGAGNAGIQGYVGGVLIANNVPFANSAGYGGGVCFIVPPSATYSVTWGGSSGDLTLWNELR